MVVVVVGVFSICNNFLFDHMNVKVCVSVSVCNVGKGDATFRV